MRIFVTGATGFLGNNLVRMLVEHGHQVTAAKRMTSDPRPLDGLNIDAVDVDLNDSSEVNLRLEEADLVIHSAAMIQLGWSKLAASRKVNVEATRTLAQAARRRGIRMIHVSTVDTLASCVDRPVDETQTEPSKPPCSYVVSKREASDAFSAEVKQGLDGVTVLPGFMVGPWDWRPSSGEMMMAIYKNLLLFAPAGGCSVVDVRDVAAGIVSAIEHGRAGQKYILGGENLTYLDLWQRMARVMQRPAAKFELPNWLAETAGRCGDLAANFLKEEPQVNTGATRMGQLRHWVDSSKAKKDLGYQTQSIETALEDAWKWFKAHQYV
jgi:dihydroflavonol-4-reductase